MTELYYVGYGSNTPQAMKGRCPDSEFIGKALLKGKRLAFRYYATIEDAPEESVWVMLYKISEKDLDWLDKYEGNPHFYTRKEVMVSTEGKDGKLYKAWVYEMLPGTQLPRIPTESYLWTCVGGYKEAGIPLSQLGEAFGKTITKVLEGSIE